MPSGMKLEAIMGIPMPRLAYMPSLNSSAALLTIFSLMAAAGEEGLSLTLDDPGLVSVLRCGKEINQDSNESERKHDLTSILFS